MNKERRKTLKDILERISAIKDDIEGVKAEEEEALDALPESLRDGEHGTTMQEAVDALDSAYSLCESLESDIETAMGQ